MGCQGVCGGKGIALEALPLFLAVALAADDRESRHDRSGVAGRRHLLLLLLFAHLLLQFFRAVDQRLQHLASDRAGDDQGAGWMRLAIGATVTHSMRRMPLWKAMLVMPSMRIWVMGVS